MQLSPVYLLALGFVVSHTLVGCSRPGEQRCTEVCEHYLELYLDHEWGEKSAKASTDEELAEIERKRAQEYKERREAEKYGFDACVNRCNRRSRGSVAECMMEAKTLDEAKKCDGDDGCSASTTPARPPLGLVLLMMAALALLVVRKRRMSRASRRPAGSP